MNNLGLETIVGTDNVSTDFVRKLNDNMNKLDVAFGLLKNHLLEKTGKNNLAEVVNYVDNLVNAQDATATANKILNGYTAYKGTQKITGTALATPTTATANLIVAGQTAYNQNGGLITGTMVNRNGHTVSTNGSVSGNNYNVAIPESGWYTNTSKLTIPVSTVMSDLEIKKQPTINVTLTGAYASYISGYGAGIDQNGELVIWAMSNTNSYEHVQFIGAGLGGGSVGRGFEISSFDTSDPVSVPHACTITALGEYDTINITLNANNINSSYDFVSVRVTLATV